MAEVQEGTRATLCLTFTVKPPLESFPGSSCVPVSRLLIWRAGRRRTKLDYRRRAVRCLIPEHIQAYYSPVGFQAFGP